MRMKKIFISHSSIDKPFVRQLAASFSGVGIDSWIDEAEIKYGESLVQKIANAIEELDIVIAIISKNSIDSSWVKKELSLAMTKEISFDKVVIIPIVIDNCEIPFFLRDKLYADFTQIALYKKNISKLIESIEWHSGVKKGNNIQTKLVGTNVVKKYNSIYFPIFISILTIVISVSVMIAVTLYGRTDRIWATFPALRQDVYIFCFLLIACAIFEMLADLMKYSVVKSDPNFADELRNMTITSLFFKRYRKLLKKYWKHTLLKVATLIEVLIYAIFPPMMLMVINIAINVILKK